MSRKIFWANIFKSWREKLNINDTLPHILINRETGGRLVIPGCQELKANKTPAVSCLLVKRVKVLFLCGGK